MQRGRRTNMGRGARREEEKGTLEVTWETKTFFLTVIKEIKICIKNECNRLGRVRSVKILHIKG